MAALGELLERNSGDPRSRLQLGQDILDNVSHHGLPSDSTMLNNFCDVLVQWLNGSNYKVALLALDILDVALDTSGDLLAPYLMEYITALMERLGDSKEQVRIQANEFILKLMHQEHTSPQIVFERMMGGLSHKQWLVRVGVMQVLQDVLQTFGPDSVQQTRIVPHVCKLVADPNSQVRDKASDTLVEMYIFTGDRLTQDIQRKRLLPESKVPTILSRFQEAKKAGLIAGDGQPLPGKAPSKVPPPIMPKPTGRLPPPSATQTSRKFVKKMAAPEDEPDRASMPSSATKASRASSVPAGKQRLQLSARSTGSAGALTEDTFYKAFTDVPKMEIFSAKELSVQMQQILAVLGDNNTEWNKRVDMLKKVRSLLNAGATDHDHFLAELKLFEQPFEQAARDLRSQVVREAAYTLAHLSELLGIKMDRLAETVMHPLVNLIQSSAKIMATSGIICARFIIKNVQSPKLVPVVTNYLNSKSREIRRECCHFVLQIVSSWQPHALERNIVIVQEAIRLGLNDADPEARSASRKAYHAFAEHYKENAELLFHSLDSSRQRQLVGEMSQSSSSQSIGASASRRSQENLTRGPVGYGGMQKVYYGNRSTSDIDTGAAKRAMQRHTQTRMKPPLQPQNSLQRPQRLSTATPRTSGARSSQSGHSVMDRQTPRTPSKSLSQPGSRSGSPTSRLPSSIRKARVSIAGRNSRGNSREQSPTNRTGNRRYSTDANSPQSARMGSRDMEKALLDALLLWDSVMLCPPSDPVHATCYPQAFCCQPGISPQLETVDEDMPSPPTGKRGGRGTFTLDDFDMSDSGSERSLNKFESAELNEAIRTCSSTQWGERKDGLAALLNFFRQNRQFTALELKKITEVFTRMFVDPHNKTFSLFLDTLVEFLAGYRSELCDWLYVLLTRLLTKLGSELLASVQTKVQKTLDVVRESFPYELQFQTLIRYVQDPLQTPSLKVKTALLNYLCDLIHVMDAGAFCNTAETRQAVSKITHWTSEPKSSDVRRSAQNVLLALFSLNASEFTAMLNTFPKAYQDTIYALLHAQLKKESAGDASFNRSARSSMSPGVSSSGGLSVDLGLVHDRLRETSAQIQYCFAGGDGEQGKGSQDSGIVDAVDSYQRVDDIANGRLMEALSITADEERQQDIISDILQELSNHNRRVTERCKAMNTLKHMARDGSFTLWDEHFKTILLILLETLGDKDLDIRANALRVLKEICLCQAARFRDYAELTLLKVLEAHRDSEKEVIRSAEECAAVLATHLPPHVCLRVLNPVIANDAPPTLLAAVKMITKVIEQLGTDEVERILPDVVPGIVKSYDNSDSSVRKASVLCLVALHNTVGNDVLLPYLEGLTNSKLKLLQLYIKRTQSSSGHL